LKLKSNMEPTVLLAASTWWPLSAQLAISLRDQGCCVESLCPPGHPLRYVSGVKRHHLYRRVGSLSALHKAILAARPKIIIPCDDAVVWQLHRLYQTAPELRVLIARSLGSPEYFETVGSREELQLVARELRIRVPRTERIASQEDLRHAFERAGHAGVLKQDGTWGGNGVRLVRSLGEAARELTRMLQPIPLRTAYKRAFINHDPTALWLGRNFKQPIVTLQEFIPGRPANLMMACWKGQVLGAVTVEVLWSHGPTGAAMVVRLIEHNEIAQVARVLAKRLELSGFHGLDFMLDANSGAAYLIELNPRCTQLGHLPIAGLGNLAGLLSKRLGAPARGSAHGPLTGPSTQGWNGNGLGLSGLNVGETIAFFPKALFWNPRSSYVRRGYQDTPWEEPALVRELLRESWPNRRWPARLYHWLKPLRQEQPKAFDEAPTLSDRSLGALPYVVKPSSSSGRRGIQVVDKDD
jgi:ATP-grasp domain